MTNLESMKATIPMVVKEIVKQYKGDIDKAFAENGLGTDAFKSKIEIADGIEYVLKFIIMPKDIRKCKMSEDIPKNSLTIMYFKMIEVLTAEDCRFVPCSTLTALIFPIIELEDLSIEIWQSVPGT